MEFINKRNFRFFLYVVIDIIIVFALNFYYLHVNQIFLYAVLILLSSLLIFLTKNWVASLFHIKVSGKFWLSGWIFSAISTLVASSFGIPIPIPVISYNNYERVNTIKGIKKGEVKLHEKWEITFISSLMLLFVSFIFISLWTRFNENAFLISGIALAIFVLLDFLPEKQFNGTNLIYHNVILYSITLLFLLVIGILSIINYSIAFLLFITFVIFIIVTYLLKLW